MLDRANFNVMTRYIAQEANLKMMMNMLRDKSKNIQFEAFHVFKVRLARFCLGCSTCLTSWMQVFVANPKKPPQIEAILRRNKEKLLTFLKNFHNDKEDEQFSVRAHLQLSARDSRLTRSVCHRQDEKQFLIVQIQNL